MGIAVGFTEEPEVNTDTNNSDMMAWAHAPPHDLSKLPAVSKRDLPPDTSTQLPKQPLRGWTSLGVAPGSALRLPNAPESTGVQKVPCPQCEGRGRRTMVTPGRECWVCDYQN